MSEINWEEEFRKECKVWEEVATILSDCILMQDCHEAHECKWDGDLYERAIELAEMFSSERAKYRNKQQPKDTEG